MSERLRPSEPRLNPPSFIREELSNAEKAEKRKRGIKPWWENLEDTLTELCPAEKDIVEPIIRTGMEKTKIFAWNEALLGSTHNNAPHLPHHNAYKITEEALKEDTSCLRPYKQIEAAKRVILSHNEDITERGREGLTLLNIPRLNKLQQLEEKMRHGESTIDDHIDYQLTKGDPLKELGPYEDPFNFLLEAITHGDLPYRIAEREIGEEGRNRKNKFKELGSRLYTFRQYTESVGKVEGYSYVLGADNVIAEFVKEKKRSSRQ